MRYEYLLEKEGKYTLLNLPRLLLEVVLVSYSQPEDEAKRSRCLGSKDSHLLTKAAVQG